MAEKLDLEIIAHDHQQSEGLDECLTCSVKICHECSFVSVNDESKKICELCQMQGSREDLKIIEKLERTIELLGGKVRECKEEMNSARLFKKQVKLALGDMENMKNGRKAQKAALEKAVVELEHEVTGLEVKVEKYKVTLIQSTTKSNMITADRDRINMEYEECNKKISEFQEMIKEQDEENQKLKDEIEEIKTRGCSEDNRKRLDESVLKKRLSKLQKNIDKVRNENQEIEQQIKILDDEDRLKSGTISVLSSKVSLISGSQLDSTEQKNNELSLQMKTQLEQTMKLYKEINDLKLKKKALRPKEVSNSNCKCLII